MTGTADHDDVFGEFACWAVRKAKSPMPELVIRGALVARLLGEAADVTEPLRLPELNLPSVKPGDLGTTEPLPDELALLVEQQVKRRHAPARWTETGTNGKDETIYTLPSWLHGAPGTVQSGQFNERAAPARTLRVRLHGEGPQVTVEDALSGEALEGPALRAIPMRHKGPSKRRRRRMAAAARLLLDELGVILGVPPSNADWLRHMVDEPKAAEREALRIWNDFVDECLVPPSFSVPRRRALSLADLLVIRRGEEGGRHRQSFANNHPWVTLNILSGDDDPDEAFRAIDENPSASITVAAKHFCCSGDSACAKAVRFAKLLPRHRQKGALDSLLGDIGTHSGDHQVRSLLLEAHEQDSELFTHIGEDIERTRRQIRRAISVLFAYRDGTSGSFPCAYSLATLLVRLMVRGDYEPIGVDPDAIARGLAAVSADSLAAFAAEQLADPAVSLPEPDADTLDTGVLALLAFIGESGRPRLTMRQLVKFTDAARHRCVHKLSAIKADTDETWPPPPGWSARKHGCIFGTRITPLTDFGSMTALGIALRNCLRDGRYHRAAVLGRLALFSIEADDGRAALALRPIAAEDSDDFEVVGWEIDQLKGPLNDDPSAGCERAANELVRLLNETCPRAISPEEVDRRHRVLEVLDRSRSFNDDTAAAKQRWVNVYTRHLPRGFAKISPSTIVESYLDGAERDSGRATGR